MARLAFRVARTTDLERLLALEAACFDASRRASPRALRQSMRSPAQAVCVAIDGAGRIVACMVLFLYARTVRLYSLAVDPAARRLGIGRRCVRRACAVARRTGRSIVSLEALADDKRLRDWYAALGFVVARELKDYYGPGRNAVRMRRTVRPRAPAAGGDGRGPA